MLDLVGLDLGLMADGGEGHGAIMGRPAEYQLRQRGERDLLVEEEAVLLEERLLGDVVAEDVVGGEVAPVESEDEVSQPGIWSILERVENRVKEQLAEVVDAVRDKSGYGQIGGEPVLARGVEGGDVDTSEVKERVTVIGGEFRFFLVV